MPRPRPTAPAVLFLIAGLPLATLVAGVWTLALIGGEGLDRVADPVRRVAQVQQVDTDADQRAARLGLRAELRRNADALRLDLAAPASLPPVQGLVLRLEHPLDARLDHERILRPEAGGWTGPVFDAGPAWRVSLTPVDGRWRLVGRWPREGQALELEPALPDAPESPDDPG